MRLPVSQEAAEASILAITAVAVIHQLATSSLLGAIIMALLFILRFLDVQP
jgi:hypothetical protein